MRFYLFFSKMRKCKESYLIVLNKLKESFLPQAFPGRITGQHRFAQINYQLSFMRYYLYCSSPTCGSGALSGPAESGRGYFRRLRYKANFLKTLCRINFFSNMYLFKKACLNQEGLEKYILPTYLFAMRISHQLNTLTIIYTQNKNNHSG